MRKGVIVILAVAIIGALGWAAKSRHKDATPLAAPGPVVSSNNSGANASAGSSVQSAQTTTYKDGTYNGQSEDTPFGTVQVAAVISGGKITDIQFLQMPSDRGHSQEVTAFAEPYLKQETLSKQSASIDFVSGATTSSEAYAESLQAALDQAKLS